MTSSPTGLTMRFIFNSPRPTRLTLRVLTTLAVLLVLAFATPAMADVEAELQDKIEAAEEEYDMLFFEEAVVIIQEGLQMAEDEGLENNTVAELHMLLGLIRHADGDEDLAVDAMVDALMIAPDIEIDSFYQTPAVDELMAQAQQRADQRREEQAEEEARRLEEEQAEAEAQAQAQAEDDDPSPDIDDPPPEDDVDPLTHDALRRADAGESLLIEAEMPADLPVFRVHLHHRRYGEDDFDQMEMEPTDAVGFAVELPADQVYTTQIEYFITAIDRSGDVIAESGRRTNPHRISVIGDHSPPESDADESPEDDSDYLVDEPSLSGPFTTLALGTDIGFLPGGTSPTANPDHSVSPGIAPAFLHSMIDVGWRFSENNYASLYFRWQLQPTQDFETLPEDRYDYDASFYRHNDECFGLGLMGDCMVGARYQRVISSGAVDFYSSVGLGVGRIRNWIKLTQLDRDDGACDGRETMEDPQLGSYCELRDTVRTGWAHFGVGGGMSVPAFSQVDLVVDSYLMVLVPDTSVNLDLNLGARIRF